MRDNIDRGRRGIIFHIQRSIGCQPQKSIYNEVNYACGLLNRKTKNIKSGSAPPLPRPTLLFESKNKSKKKHKVHLYNKDNKLAKGLT